MATVTKKGIATETQIGGVPWGNMTILHFPLETNSTGVWVGSDQATAIQVNDVLNLGILPAGLKIWDYIANISDAFTGSSTGKIGFKYVDGVDSTAVPQDDDYFCAATSLASQAKLRMTNVAVRPVTLPKPAYLTLTWAGAHADAVGKLDIGVIGVMTGQP